LNKYEIIFIISSNSQTTNSCQHWNFTYQTKPSCNWVLSSHKRNHQDWIHPSRTSLASRKRKWKL